MEKIKNREHDFGAKLRQGSVIENLTSYVNWEREFKAGAANEDHLAILDRIAPLLTADDRSLPQGALAWVLGASERTIPIPGFTSAAQIRDNVEAVWQGRLPADTMARLKEIVAGG